MRKRFDQQYKLGTKLISETSYPFKSRDEFPALVTALVEIYKNNIYNENIFSILESSINANKQNTGRPGMDLWQIFVLAQTRLVLNTNYDRLHVLVNSDTILRQLIGIETETGFESRQISLQTLKDNVSLLTDKMLKEINIEIVAFGHAVLKKKEEEALSLKTDSFVVESTVHFPTDYNLLWDSVRKCLDIVELHNKEIIKTKGWRKSSSWRRDLKSLSRALGQASSTRGKSREKNILTATNKYLKKAKLLFLKLQEITTDFDLTCPKESALLIDLKFFMSMVIKHIDLVERRLILGEKIPHSEKVFSIFEVYTEWISKGKINKKVELGKRLSITTDQFNLIVDYYLHENITDSDSVIEIADRIVNRWEIDRWSFDKGYWNKDNKELLEMSVRKVVMSKKGKPNLNEKANQSEKEFKKYSKKHSAIESNINELENRGLDRCPDKSLTGFTRYVGIAVTAYNLHKIGKALLEIHKKEEQKYKKKVA